MSTAPEWMVDALGEHYVPDELDGYAPVLCLCGELIDPPSSRGDVNAHDRLYRVHVAQALWDAFPPAVLQIPEGTLEGQMPLPMLSGLDPNSGASCREPRVIPSRSTDPGTSHQAAATITVKAGTQRAHLLRSFYRASLQDNNPPRMSDAKRDAARAWWASLCGIKPSTFEAFNAGWDAAEEAQRQWEVQQVEARVIPSRSTDPATSHQAAATITVKAGTQRARLLQAFAWVEEYEFGKFNKGNLTDEEAMEWADGVDPRSEYSKRCSELREAGLIEPTGETRTGASGHQRIVSRITEAGRKVVQGL